MKTVCTALALTLYLLALVIGSAALPSDSGALQLIQKDQCDASAFEPCATNFFNNFGVQLPLTDELGFLKNLLQYIEHKQVDGVKDICHWLDDFDKCDSHQCWTAANFKSIGVVDGNYFAAGFAAALNFCEGDGLNLVIKYALRCFFYVLPHYPLLLNCISHIDLHHIMNTSCDTAATALTCAINVLENSGSCNIDMDQAICQSIVFGGDILLPKCKPQFDAACSAKPPSSTAQPPNTTPQAKTSSTASTTTMSNQNPTPTTPQGSSVGRLASSILLLLFAFAIINIV